LARRARQVLASVAPGSEFRPLLSTQQRGRGKGDSGGGGQSGSGSDGCGCGGEGGGGGGGNEGMGDEAPADARSPAPPPRLSIRAVGFCYEIQFGGVTALGAPLGAVVTVVVFLWMVWRRKVLVLLRPIRMPMRMHAD
jgi:hypothetical protein